MGWEGCQSWPAEASSIAALAHQASYSSLSSGPAAQARLVCAGVSLPPPARGLYKEGMAEVTTEEPPVVEWPACEVQGCIGIRLDGQKSCLAHVISEVRDAFVGALEPGAPLDLRGVQISEEMFQTILEAMRTAAAGHPQLGEARFDKAQFTGDASFEGTQFSGVAWFEGAQFSADASFEGTQFSADASLEGTQFSGVARFDKAKFSGDARFQVARFSGVAWFQGAQFSGASFEGTQFSPDTSFEGTQFSGVARFDKAQFSGDAWFQGVQFSDSVSFEGTQYSGEARFDKAQFSGDASFQGTQFSMARQLGPIRADVGLDLAGAVFSADVLIEAATPQLSFVGARFEGAASLNLRFAEVVLDGTLFAKPSTISFAMDAFKDLDEAELVARRPTATPRLLSVRRVDVSTVSVSDLDLSACLFTGAHNLEKLHIEGPLQAATTPRWRLYVAGRGLPIPRWMRRATLAEEHQRRASPRPVAPAPDPRWGFLCPSWCPPGCQTPTWVVGKTGQEPLPPSWEGLAQLYRALRKGLEDQKNAPGAADFYYGEMEMRKRSPSSFADGVVLWIYWLLSGYGLRASRALTAFAVVVLLFAPAYWAWGLSQPTSFWTALLRSFESATSLLRSPPGGLSQIGELFDAVLRLLGGTLLGLALFSFRGRIRR
jgi:uncharacterized protein YjbI with pentapeptide repeats